MFKTLELNELILESFKVITDGEDKRYEAEQGGERGGGALRASI